MYIPPKENLTQRYLITSNHKDFKFKCGPDWIILLRNNIIFEPFRTELTWFIRYVYYWNLQFLNNVIIIKNKRSSTLDICDHSRFWLPVVLLATSLYKDPNCQHLFCLRHVVRRGCCEYVRVFVMAMSGTSVWLHFSSNLHPCSDLHTVETHMLWFAKT